MKIRNALIVSGIALAGAAILLGAPGYGQRAPEVHAADTSRSVGTVIDDNVISARVKSALIADAEVKGFDFKVATRKGEVQLSGFVDNLAQINRAITIAKGIEGVKSVDNKVTLKVGRASIGSTIDDGIVTASVKSAFLADPEVNALQIAVVTRKGVVQLSGYADSRTQVERALQIARAVDGVTGVNNELNIKK